MKYVVAFYKSLLDGNNRTIPFGAVVTDGKSIKFDFDNSEERQSLIRQISETFDPLIFTHFKDTFKDGFIKSGVAVTTDADGTKHTIPVVSEEFLDYLTRNSQGTYQYTKAYTAEAENPEALLTALMQRIEQLDN
jgi:hypothetical protein